MLNIQKFAKMLDGHQMVTTEEFKSAISDFINAFAQHRSAFAEISKKNESTMNEILLNLQSEFDKMRGDVTKETGVTKEEMRSMLAKCMSDMKKMCDEMESRLPQDGKDGMDADEERIIEEVLAKIKLPEAQLLDTPDEVVEKINKSTKKIAKERVEGLEQAIMNSASSAVASLPVTTMLVNGKRSKNLSFTGSGVSTSTQGDTTTVTVTSGAGSTVYVETPNEAIDGVTTAFTVDNSITKVISIHINGQFIHPVDYSVAGSTITFGVAPDAALIGLPFTVVYV